MGQASKSLGDLAVSLAKGEWLTRSELIALAHILKVQTNNQYQGLREFDDHAVLLGILRDVEQIPDVLEIAKEEAEAIESDRAFQHRLEAIRKGYDVRAA